ncbi:HET domain protein [Halenospora varia]|nr:HET domain protein [Halenospora varia]
MSSFAERCIKTMSPAKPTLLSGPEENAKTQESRLCSICQGMLIRPYDDWNESLHNQPYYTKRAVDDVVSSATNGCTICAILWDSILSTRKSRPWIEDGSETVACMLHWNGKSGKFDAIHFNHSVQVHFDLLLDEDVNYLVLGDKNQLRKTSSDASWKLITRWLTECTKNHQSCNQAAKQDTWFPTRLIDVGIQKVGSAPRLILAAETQFGAGKDAYLALSHSWGSKQMETLTTTNISALQDGILLDKLPTTFKDAIRVARRLGIRYLWIDSLCIIQDSKDDWRKEAAVMGKVYQRSYCNIAANAAAEGYEGLFIDRDPSLHSPFKVNLKWKGHERSYYCLYNELWHYGISRTALNRRGWVLQERLLSPRTLYFNHQLFWECRELKACEAFPQGLGPNADFEPDDYEDDSELCPKSWATEITRGSDKYAPWTKVVESFMISGLTKGADKLTALSGIAKEMRSLLDDNYVAGLWERNLAFDLLWYIEKRRQVNWDCSFRVKPYRAPSWSWASVEGRVQFPRGRHDISWGVPLVEILAVEVESVTGDSTGELSSGYILVSGILKRMSELDMFPEHTLDLFPGAATACCIDDMEDFSLKELYCFPIRSMKGHSQEELLCLILTLISGSSDTFRRVGLLALAKDEIDEIDGLEWDIEEWNKVVSS